MNDVSNARFRLIASLIMAAAAICAHFILNATSSDVSEANWEHRLQAVMHAHESDMRHLSSVVSDSLASPSCPDAVEALSSVEAEDDYSFYVFHSDSLVAWHNPSLPSPLMSAAQLCEPVMQSENGFYYVVKGRSANYDVCVLFRVYSRNPYENDYLVTGMHPSFGVTSSGIVTSDSASYGCRITDSCGQYLFSVSNPKGAGVPLSMYVFDCVCLSLWLVFSLAAVAVAARCFGCHVARCVCGIAIRTALKHIVWLRLFLPASFCLQLVCAVALPSCAARLLRSHVVLFRISPCDHARRC